MVRARTRSGACNGAVGVRVLRNHHGLGDAPLQRHVVLGVVVEVDVEDLRVPAWLRHTTLVQIVATDLCEHPEALEDALELLVIYHAIHAVANLLGKIRLLHANQLVRPGG